MILFTNYEHPAYTKNQLMSWFYNKNNYYEMNLISSNVTITIQKIKNIIHILSKNNDVK